MEIDGSEVISSKMALDVDGFSFVLYNKIICNEKEYTRRRIDMPYCPKCDMEFVDGITTCSDCGGPLVESKEAADAMKRELEEKERLEREREQAAWMAEAARLYADAAEGEAADGDCGGDGDDADASGRFPSDGGSSSGATGVAGTAGKKAAAAKASVYVSKRQRVEDMRSSVSAFLIVGGLFLVFGILTLCDIVHLPLASGSGLLFKLVLTALGAACLVVAFITRGSAARMAKEADAEDQKTKERIEWFLSSYTAEALDQDLLAEDPTLSGNELELKRFELIQDRMITNLDLPDPAYVDSLAEEIYGKLYE